MSRSILKCLRPSKGAWARSQPQLCQMSVSADSACGTSERGTRTLLAQICHAADRGRMGERTSPTTKTLLIYATTATFLNDSLREAFVIPYMMQFLHSVGRTVGCVQVAPRKRSRWAANMAFRGTMASVFGFTMRCEQTCRRAQSVVKTCGNLSKSKAEMRWAAKSSHLDAAIQHGGIAQNGTGR